MLIFVFFPVRLENKNKSGQTQQAKTDSSSSNSTNSNNEQVVASANVIKSESSETTTMVPSDKVNLKREDESSSKKHVDTHSKPNLIKSPSSSSGSSNKYRAELEEARQEIKRLKEQIFKTSKSSTSIGTNSPSNLASAQHGPDDHSNTSTSSSSLNPTTNVSTNESSKKVRALEETIRDLYKSLSNKKQEEVALLNDMEITGQAFEDMQVMKSAFKDFLTQILSDTVKKMYLYYFFNCSNCKIYSILLLSYR
jgi:hypothetical protein